MPEPVLRWALGETSPSRDLCAVLSVNLWFQHLQTHEVWSRWIWNEKADLGGLFSSRTVSSAWCVIALPLLIAQTRWRKLLALPALYGVAASGRTTVFVALAVWLAWSVWPWVKRRPWVGGLSLTGFALAWFWRVESIGDMIHGSLPRLATWPVILRAIVTNPLGIGSAALPKRHATNLLVSPPARGILS